MSKSSSAWKELFPYETDYCDHFETPQKAYDDIAPLLDILTTTTSDRSEVTLYDPYYCDGRAGKLLRRLGFQVQHERRDFYKDINDGKVPHHDILVTNPPFSDQHKKVTTGKKRSLVLSCISIHSSIPLRNFAYHILEMP